MKRKKAVFNLLWIKSKEGFFCYLWIKSKEPIFSPFWTKSKEAFFLPFLDQEQEASFSPSLDQEQEISFLTRLSSADPYPCSLLLTNFIVALFQFTFHWTFLCIFASSFYILDFGYHYPYYYYYCYRAFLIAEVRSSPAFWTHSLKTDTHQLRQYRWLHITSGHHFQFSWGWYKYQIIYKINIHFLIAKQILII